MGCNTAIPNYTACGNIINYNRNVLINIMYLPDNTRKVIRLLAKQFEITYVEMKADVYVDDFIIEHGGFVIHYEEYGGNVDFQMPIIIKK